QFARVRAKHLLGFWIRHLVLCWLSPAPALASCLIGRPADGPGIVRHELPRVAEPARLLDALVARYDEGQGAPLRFFPSSSRLFAEQFGKKQKPGWDLASQVL